MGLIRHDDSLAADRVAARAASTSTIVTSLVRLGRGQNATSSPCYRITAIPALAQPSRAKLGLDSPRARESVQLTERSNTRVSVLTCGFVYFECTCLAVAMRPCQLHCPPTLALVVKLSVQELLRSILVHVMLRVREDIGPIAGTPREWGWWRRPVQAVATGLRHSAPGGLAHGRRPRLPAGRRRRGGGACSAPLPFASLRVAPLRKLPLPGVPIGLLHFLRHTSSLSRATPAHWEEAIPLTV